MTIAKMLGSTAVLALAATAFAAPATAATAVFISTTSLPTGTVSTAYKMTLQAAGGTAPYRWKIAAGGLPYGLSLSSAGLISGTPEARARGTWSVTPRVTDKFGHVAQRAFTLKIASTAPLGVASTSTRTGYVGLQYASTLSALGGTRPYKWRISAGSLPAGLVLNTAGGISGEPSSKGTSSFTATVTDTAGHSASRALTLQVADPVATDISGRCAGAAFDSITTCTVTVANKTTGPTPTGEVEVFYGRDDLVRCVLKASTSGRASCTVEQYWGAYGTLAADLTYFGDSAHAMSQGGLTTTVPAPTGGYDTTATFPCANTSDSSNRTCVVSVSNKPAAAGPAPTGYVVVGYGFDGVSGTTEDCVLRPTSSAGRSSCAIAVPADALVDGVRVTYFGDSTHHAAIYDIGNSTSGGGS